MNTVHIKYYALLKEESGLNSETLQTDCITVQDLYVFLRKKYAFKLSTDILRVSVNSQYVHWQTHIKENDEIVFIPPVAGG
ncbi:MAG: MoaD/ThiS family protein [Candidatus Omnitrophica bacterium]|nr:MoaD/ThiS family protein [Candidatus Omnitrophota bacterium]